MKELYGKGAQEAIAEYKAAVLALQEAKNRFDQAARWVAGALEIQSVTGTGYIEEASIRGYIDCWERSAQLIRGTRLLESDALRERSADDGQPEG